jgi:hypothetical protein
MARGSCTFRKRDVTAAIKAAVDAGVPVARVEVNKDGNIVIIMQGAEIGAARAASNEWDEQ